MLIKTSVTGDGRTLAVKSPVYRDERIRTSAGGLGEFVFRDGTRFAVGGNSSVVIDKFVYDSSNSAKSISVKAAKGSFRWISGGANSSAYKIATPAGTIGIRGTAFDIFIGSGGQTAVVLLKGSVRFCGSNGCRDLRRRCDYIAATPRGGVSNPKRVSRDALREMRDDRALPFMTGKQRLSSRFQVGADCMSTASLNPSRTPARASAPASGPEPSPAPEPAPSPSPSPGRGNNGKGNGGGDGSPNGRGDEGR
ncbi:FecR domain-containing protein [Mesorhizobium sp. ZMM04-5]|uniref:FecR domain-containing protein n=1 Tax=Mesorhizobium marinum TaxID=3228790 RepID=A0ABV3R3I8_9HYPH